MKKYLIKLADHLDNKGFYKEANYIDWIMKNAKVDFSNTNYMQVSKDELSDYNRHIVNQFEKHYFEIDKEHNNLYQSANSPKNKAQFVAKLRGYEKKYGYNDEIYGHLPLAIYATQNFLTKQMLAAMDDLFIDSTDIRNLLNGEHSIQKEGDGYLIRFKDSMFSRVSPEDTKNYKLNFNKRLD